MNYIVEYWEGIKTGKYIVSKRVYRQYERLVNDMREKSHNSKYIFDESKANKPIEFIERFCKHSKGEWAGKPVILELFQKAYISALFGFIDKETGLRRYKESMFYVARKNGKTTMLSGIAAYMMIADGEGGAEVFSIATKKDQARLLFDETHNMIKQSPDLSKHIKKRKSDLYFPLTMSRLQPLGKNSDTLDGLNAHCVIMDELHSIKDRNLYEVMKQSMSARREPLMIMITTAGTVRECIFDDMYEYACNVVDGTFQDDTFLPILYELDKKEEWTDPKAWPKANPGLGIIKKIDDLEVKVERAKNNPKDLSGVLTKDFNIRDTISSAWLTFDDLNNDETFDIKAFKNCYAIGGADLSITTDLTCATLLLMDKDSHKRYIHQMYWLPRDSFEKRVQLDKIPYDKWLQRGLLRLCNGNSINYTDVTAWFNEMLNDYGITPLWIYYDSYSAKYWVEEMEQHGFKMVRCIQGARTLSLPMQMMGADLQARKINYNNNPILKWCLTNTGVETDRNGNIVPIKNQAAKQRIDGTASMLDAYTGLFEHYEEFIRSL
ncbi:terminase large subunit [Clostridium botulinum]|uniref:terminase large subunit n=1 Tax=Clostridium botulinum TaxID=1491 RepID=UPI000773BA5F|nr:terminase large subunit [Clostridium botulinum]AUN16119.1 terminase [Clostridium botulinum]AUN16140.1 terminase [Clostridium botulinum]MBN3375832.1 terminase [Clostridium botulinum]MBN3399559.1 terminase [Clostridium botulinum]MBN3414482.1 terminase [Clostridium botulinum]